MKRMLSIVAAAYNEANNLSEFLRRAAAIRPALAKIDFDLEIVIVDDHSSDATPRLMNDLADQYANLKYVRLSRNCGAHSAVTAGLKFCSGGCAAIMAADLQDPPETLPALLDRWLEGHDVVWACREAREGESFATQAASRIFYRIMRLLSMPEMPAKGADFLLIGRNVIDAYNAIPEKHTNCVALIMWMGFRQTSMQYVKQARREGKSKWTLAKKVKLFIDSVVSFSYVPIRFTSALGLVMAAGGFLYALLVVVGRICGWVNPGTGFAALMTVLLVGQGAILLTLGILGEYLWRTYDEARGRPRYIIEEYRPSRNEAVAPQAQGEQT